ncbi:hypothetical protein [Pseudoalteromonas caenipelagi]|uniref:hypothetical protein n=1 Tax=Pseudoalteromonas caenipelagi TaxID=2726988 RepID=UPI0014931118|nr:hypothetical protein [Pseudoalteromonas caenipelagi]
MNRTGLYRTDRYERVRVGRSNLVLLAQFHIADISQTYLLPQNKLENFAQRGINGSERILLSQHKFDDMN